MRTRSIPIGIATVVLGHSLLAQTLKKVATIDLQGPKGQRFDYLTMDQEDHYLLSGHLGPGILYVIDVRTNRLVKAIPGVPGITGLEYVPGLKKVYTSNWGENKIGVVDLQKMQVIKRLATGEKPNGSTYAEPFGKIYVSDTIAKQEAVVDVHKDVIVKTLSFDSETGTPQYDPVSRKVYINLRTVNQVAVVDPATDTVVGRFPVAGCEHNHGMALDPDGRRAFLLCGGNHTFTVFDLDGNKSVAHLPLPAGADVVKFDPGLKRVYAACSSGVIMVVQEDDPNHFRKLEDFPVQPKVHSLALDTETHRVYAPEEEEDGKPVARMVVYEPVTPSGKAAR
jgi:DNA-binding beta-propeller fold protein YncE